MDRQIATLFGIGHLRPGPGTWASLVTLAVGWGLHRIGHFPLVAAGTLLVLVVGWRAVVRYTAAMTDRDRPEIVVDEMAGQLIALCATSAGFWSAGLPREAFPWPGLVAPFLFFRLFDIWKPSWLAAPTAAPTRRASCWTMCGRGCSRPWPRSRRPGSITRCLCD